MDESQGMSGQGYSFRDAVVAEWKANPYRSILGTLTAIPVILVAIQFLQEAWLPDPSYVAPTVFHLDKLAGPGYQGSIVLVTGAEIPVRRISGQYAAMAFDGTFVKPQPLLYVADASGAVPPTIVVEFESVPKDILLCLGVENKKGALVHQSIMLEFENKDGADNIINKMAVFVPVQSSRNAQMRCEGQKVQFVSK